MKACDVRSGFLIRLERGENVLASLAGVCEEKGIDSGVFQAVGAVKNAEIGYYELATKKYFFRTFAEDREVASMTGNIALVDGKPFIHAHAVLSATDESLACVGGHLKECEVAVTLEVYVTPFHGAVTREMDDAIGLKLLHI